MEILQSRSLSSAIHQNHKPQSLSLSLYTVSLASLFHFEFEIKVGFIGWYLGKLDSRPILTKTITTSLIFAAADLTAQMLSPSSGSGSFDLIRTLRMAAYGLLILGPSQHLWFNLMSKTLPKRDVLTTLKKTFMGQAIYGPANAIVFFSYNAALQGESGDEIVARLKRDVLPTLRNGLLYWPFCDFLHTNLFQFIYRVHVAGVKKVATSSSPRSTSKWWSRLQSPHVGLPLPFIDVGLLKLHHDVRACEYEDVRVMWEMLKRNETENAKLSGRNKKRSFWDCFSWASRVCGNPHGLIRKYGLMCCRQCFRSNAKEIGFIKASGLWVSYLVVGTALMFLNFSFATTTLSISDVVFTDRSNRMIMTETNRKLKENSYNHKIDKNNDARNLTLDDYHPIDPAPSSKASIKPGPIEHGTPLNPYIPKHPPPSPAPPKKVGYLN
ncbi:hypothetical protein GH714_004459 [Hevea brasiliensis]|uniref:40S ribosomal protein S29 n=1 Tax=Hevea brasiliensis TaxID=3981 RepID=A0A6A6M7F0_HEVBR|nr:hypothetical protein GH714_004459 [Hevea brasiliensis]